MTIVYDPLTYRTVVARPGEIPYKFWSVNKHVIDAASAGICTLHSGDEAPGDTSRLWLDLTMPENAVGAVKAYDGASWVALTPALFYSHIAGGAGGFVTTTTYGRALLVLADAASGRIAFGVRDVLSANRTYYVRTDGSDSNDGSANTSGAAFLTIQKAIDTVGLLDTSIHDVTISITSGTYTGAVTLKNFVGAGLCTLTCPSGTATISTTSSNAIYGNLITCRYALGSGLKLQTTTSGSCLYLDKSAIELKGAEFGASASVHVVLDGSFCFVRNNYTISGSAANHVLASTGSQFIYLGGVTVTLTGTPAFTNFVSATNDSAIRAIAVTFSGSATGGSYSVAANSVISTNGGGASYFPGNSAGSTATGGQYI